MKVSFRLALRAALVLAGLRRRVAPAAAAAAPR